MESILRPGDTFYEPANETISRFDATNEGVTFLARFPMPAGIAAKLVMGTASSNAAQSSRRLTGGTRSAVLRPTTPQIAHPPDIP